VFPKEAPLSRAVINCIVKTPSKYVAIVKKKLKESFVYQTLRHVLFLALNKISREFNDFIPPAISW